MHVFFLTEYLCGVTPLILKPGLKLERNMRLPFKEMQPGSVVSLA